MRKCNFKKAILSVAMAFALLGSVTTVNAKDSETYSAAVATEYLTDNGCKISGSGSSKTVINESNNGADDRTKYKYEKEQVTTDAQGTSSSSYAYANDLVGVDGTLNVDVYQKLDSSAQRAFLQDYNSAAETVRDTDESYSDNDYQDWLSELQQKDGVGSKLMTTLLKNTKPDFATANRIYEPFSGTVGTVLGLIAVLLMAALAIVMVLDLSYIAIPFVRNLLDGGADEGNGGNGVKSRFVSWEAYSAVQQVEGGQGNSGQQGSENKAAVGIYFKKRVVMLLILGICLLYLVQGEIFTLVGYFIDIVSGFLPS
jgi:hypothetical protein